MASTYPTSLDSFTNPSAVNLLTSPSHAQQHADINDAMEAVQTKLAIGNTTIGVYLSYTPTFSAGLTLGNGTVFTRYCRANNFVHYYGRVTFGSTTSLSGAAVVVTTPTNVNNNFDGYLGSFNGQCGLVDDSTSISYTGNCLAAITGDALQLNALDSGVAYLRPAAITSTVPFTWTTSDQIFWNCVYEAV